MQLGFPRRAVPLVLAIALTPAVVSPLKAQEAAKPARPAQGTDAAASDDRQTDRASIRSTLDGFTKAFESRDPKALASFWTTGAEYHNVAGIELRGKEKLEKAFTMFFARTPEVKAEVRPESLRFPSRDSAIEEGSVSVRRGPAEPASRAHYRALLVREDGQWRFAQLEESAENSDSVEDLGWLVGEWRSKSGQDAEIHTTYSWAPNKKFLNVEFTVKRKERTVSGRQVIGVDPATGNLHSWTFEADGGVGEADWSRDGDHWLLDAAGTLTDGRALTETNILRRIDADTFTWQSVDRILDDDELSDLAPVKVTRVKPTH